MLTQPPPPTDAEKQAFFRDENELPPDGIFELGLVLGGTVAAGAYTAGALDALLQALDAFEGVNWPSHKVRIPFVAGASGGAICAAMLALVSRRRITPIDPANTAVIAGGAPASNPLWDTWVNAVDGRRMLGTADLGTQPLVSLLNATVLDDIAGNMERFAATPQDAARPYFPAPFRMAVTLTNLRGIPYVMGVQEAQGWTGAAYVAHDDFARFAVPNGAAAAQKRPDEFWLDSAAGTAQDFVGVRTMIDYAVASAAFPAGLPARKLDRPARHYAFRPVVKINPHGNEIRFPQPVWDIITKDGAAYDFVSVDGGAFNNDPVTLVHQALAGMVGRNETTPEFARRAMFMIDPLAVKPASLRVPDTALLKVVSSLLGTLVDGARYLTADMQALADPGVYSRFQLVPTRQDSRKLGEEALATAPFSAFGGFFSRAYRVHDFLLGRQNMRNYLRTELVQRASNPLFNCWPEEQRRRFAQDEHGNRTEESDRAKYFLPVIPDPALPATGTLAIETTADSPIWPWNAFNPAWLKEPMSKRIDAVLTTLRQQQFAGLAGWLAGGVMIPALTSFATDKIIKAFEDDLQAWGLRPKS